MDLVTLMMVCAPFASSDTMLAVMKQESGGNPWALGVNSRHEFKRPKNYFEAVAEARRLIANGASIDMGLMQINSATMVRLGLTIEQVYDPCTNAYAGGVVLTRNYVLASKSYGQSRAALEAALSAYNTGNFKKGFENGYVQKVLKHANSRN